MRALLLALVALVSAALPLRAEVLAREGKGYLERAEHGGLVLHLKGTPYEMGFQHGRLLREQVRGMARRILDNQDGLGKTAEYQAYLMMRPLMHDLLRPHIPARFREEMRGLADGAEVPYADVEASNLFPEAFHCSGIALRGAATKDGALYHVRILDYMTRLGLQDVALVIVHQPTDEGLRSWINVGFAGFIGTVTGMNEAQVALGEMGGSGLGHWDGVPMALLMRDALERAGTLAEALEVFRASPRTCEYYYVISDGKTRDAVGIWATPDVLETIQPGESYALFDNLRPRGGAAAGKAFAGGLKVDANPHRVLLQGQGGVKGFVALQRPDTLVLSGPDRYGHFMERLAPRYGEVDEQVLMDLVKRPVSMASNLHVAIFRPETLEVWVAIAAADGDPACDQPYLRYDLRAALTAGPK
ncbi:MAG: C45 family autoproteolytic acyltransferase/hydrolase [Planctomycetes bacterium]|nr:C45 family autoproteolytic acyltransferase/hydrolase [Planctomycetota bacterium]